MIEDTELVQCNVNKIYFSWQTDYKSRTYAKLKLRRKSALRTSLTLFIDELLNYTDKLTDANPKSILHDTGFDTQ